MLNRFQDQLLLVSPHRWPALYDELLQAVGTHLVADRPDRYEPCAATSRTNY